MWGVFEEFGLIHVVPLDDKKLHELSHICECDCYLNNDGVFVHNAYDERELTENLPRC